MRFRKVYDSEGNHIGTVVDDDSGSGGGGPTIIHIIVAVALVAYTIVIVMSDMDFLNNIPLVRPLISVGTGDFITTNGVKWIKEVWKDGGIRGKVEIIQFFAAMLLPTIIGMVNAIKHYKDRYSIVGAIFWGLLFFLPTLILCSCVNCLIDRGFGHFISFAIEYFSCYFLDLFILYLLPITGIVVVFALIG